MLLVMAWREHTMQRVWLVSDIRLTVPTLGKPAGPIATPDYISHLRDILNSDLAALAAARIDPALLPPC